MLCMENYDYPELYELSDSLQRQLSLLYIKHGVKASVAIRTPVNTMENRETYPSHYDGYKWILVIDVDVFKNKAGTVIKTNVTERQINKFGEIDFGGNNLFDIVPTREIVSNLYGGYTDPKKILKEEDLKGLFISSFFYPQWHNLVWRGGRMLFFIYGDGTIKRLPSDYVFYCHCIDICPESVYIEECVYQHFKHPFTRASERTDLIKAELYSKCRHIE